MTEALVPTKEHPAPLDAFETAKPDEPIWTVQGGDPLGPPLLRIWAWAARIRAGVIDPAIPDEERAVSELVAAARDHGVSHDDKEVRNLKIRATATEEISWTMEEYAKGQVNADQPSEAADTHFDELARIDLHDLRVRFVSKLGNAIFELREAGKALRDKGYDNTWLLDEIEVAAEGLDHIREVIEPRRVMKRND